MNKIKTACAGVAAFAGRHKKAAVVLALLVVAAVAADLLLPRRAGRGAVLPAAGGSYVRTVTLQKGTLEDSISATGTVQSSDVSNVTTDLKYTVKTVDVQVGDSVEAGDVICTLDTSDLEIANRIARSIRAAGGGFKYCKAIGVMLGDRNIAQVSMNLVNYEGTPIYYVFEMIRALADRWGVRIIGSELVGLTPAKALLDCAEYYLKLENFDCRRQVMEYHLIGREE